MYSFTSVTITVDLDQMPSSTFPNSKRTAGDIYPAKVLNYTIDTRRKC